MLRKKSVSLTKEDNVEELESGVTKDVGRFEKMDGGAEGLFKIESPRLGCRAPCNMKVTT